MPRLRGRASWLLGPCARVVAPLLYAGSRVSAALSFTCAPWSIDVEGSGLKPFQLVVAAVHRPSGLALGTSGVDVLGHQAWCARPPLALIRGEPFPPLKRATLRSARRRTLPWSPQTRGSEVRFVSPLFGYLCVSGVSPLYV